MVKVKIKLHKQDLHEAVNKINGMFNEIVCSTNGNKLFIELDEVEDLELFEDLNPEGISDFIMDQLSKNGKSLTTDQAYLDKKAEIQAQMDIKLGQ